MTLYSIGHSSLPADVFLSHLELFGISLVIDVRRYPMSRRHPHFGRSALESLLAGKSIEYLHLGEELGGFREGAYEEYVRTEAFRRGLATLLEHAARDLAFLCAEKNPWECHRRFIAAELSGMGYEVRHIVDGQLMLIRE